MQRMNWLKAEAICTAAVKQMIELARGNHVPHVMVAQYLFQDEMTAGPRRGHEVLKQAIESEGIKPVQIGDAFVAAVKSGKNPFGVNDIRHPNELGHQIIADELTKAVEAELSGATTTAPTMAATLMPTIAPTTAPTTAK